MLSPLTLSAIFTPSECARIIAAAEAHSFADARLVGGARHDGIRRARIAWLDTGGEADWIFDRLVDTVIEANRRHFSFDLADFAERMQVASYTAETGGRFDWHVDQGEGPLAASVAGQEFARMIGGLRSECLTQEPH